MSDQVIANVNGFETNISNNVVHRANSGDASIRTNISDNSDGNGSNTASVSHGHGLGASDSREQANFDLDIPKMSYMMMSIGLLLAVLAYTLIVKVPDTPNIPINLLRAFYITSKVLFFWGMFLLLFALCGTQEVSVAYAVIQRTFLWASVPLLVVVIGLRVAISISALQQKS